MRAATVQSTVALAVGREHDPSSPKKRLAPSVPSEEFEDGVTVNSATLSWSKRLGAKKAKKERIREVKASSGVRYKTTALDRPAIMILMAS